MARLSALTGFCRRLLRSRLLVFFGMVAGAYALSSGAPARAAVNSACATGNSDAYYASIPFGQQFYRTFVDGLTGACQPCHAGINGSFTRSTFGAVYESQSQIDLGADYVHAWTVALATADSDGDGYTNGEELQDPQGAWHKGDPNPPGGDSTRVRNPNDAAAIPPAPTISQLLGVTSGATIRGGVTLQVQLDTTIGARSVLYEIINGSSQVVQSFTKQTASYTALTSTFDQSWDTNTLPNGVYTVRATLTDATGLVGRKNTRTVTNVTLSKPTLAVSAAGSPSRVPSNGTFTISRDLPAGDLLVHFTLGGTAALGTDYTVAGGGLVLSGANGTLTIPNGTSTLALTVAPLAGRPSGQTITLALQPDPAYAMSRPLRVRKRAGASGASRPRSHSTWALASVAWPHRSTSAAGVNQRSR